MYIPVNPQATGADQPPSSVFLRMIPDPTFPEKMNPTSSCWSNCEESNNATDCSEWDSGPGDLRQMCYNSQQTCKRTTIPLHFWKSAGGMPSCPGLSASSNTSLALATMPSCESNTRKETDKVRYKCVSQKDSSIGFLILCVVVTREYYLWYLSGGHGSHSSFSPPSFLPAFLHT